MNCSKFASAAVLWVCGGLVASAQSFNIDLDVGFGPPEGGNGAPSQSFQGAAGQAGFWNRIAASGPSVSTPLFALNGSSTGTQILATGGIGSSGGSGSTVNSGDYCLLLNDYADIAGAINYHFTGFAPGRYLIYTYAVKANDTQVTAIVTVPGALIQTQVVTGPMPGNSFVLGQTHAVHDLLLTGSAFDIQLSGGGPPDPSVNGFQIVAVPEPLTLIAFCAGLATLVSKRRRR